MFSVSVAEGGWIKKQALVGYIISKACLIKKKEIKIIVKLLQSFSFILLLSGLEKWQ